MLKSRWKLLQQQNMPWVVINTQAAPPSKKTSVKGYQGSAVQQVIVQVGGVSTKQVLTNSQ